VQARHALGSVGYRNRFGHPHAQVLARYDEAGVPVYLTRDCGTLRFTLGEPRMTGEETVPACPRRDGPRWPWRSGR
jgi:competence protein ComEC